LTAGASASTATFVVTVTSPAAAGLSNIVNAASIADDGANGTDPTPANNSSTDTDTLNAAPDLTLGKTDGVSKRRPGRYADLYPDLQHAGTQNATGVVLTENLPAGATFVSAGSTAGWTETGSRLGHLPT